MGTKNYTCETCGKETSADALAASPECCGKPMKESSLDPCFSAHDAESSRPIADEDACDDFVR